MAEKQLIHKNHLWRRKAAVSAAAAAAIIGFGEINYAAAESAANTDPLIQRIDKNFNRIFSEMKSSLKPAADNRYIDHPIIEGKPIDRYVFSRREPGAKLYDQAIAYAHKGEPEPYMISVIIGTNSPQFKIHEKFGERHFLIRVNDNPEVYIGDTEFKHDDGTYSGGSFRLGQGPSMASRSDIGGFIDYLSLKALDVISDSNPKQPA